MKLGLLIFFILILTGGLSGYLGDYLGRKVGRKKFKIFSLRPKHSAYVVTVIAGIVLASLMFGAINIVSPVRNNLTTLDVTQDLNEFQTSLLKVPNVVKVDVPHKANPVKLVKKTVKPPDTQPSVSQNIVNVIPVKIAPPISHGTYYRYPQIHKIVSHKPVYNGIDVSKGDVLLNAQIGGLQSEENSKHIMYQLLDITDNHVKKISGNKNQTISISPDELQNVANSIKQDGNYLVQLEVSENNVKNKVVPVHFVLKKTEVPKTETVVKDEPTGNEDLGTFLDNQRIKSSNVKTDITKSIDTVTNKPTEVKTDIAKTSPSQKYSDIVKNLPSYKVDNNVQMVVQKNKTSKKTLDVQVKTLKKD